MPEQIEIMGYVFNFTELLICVIAVVCFLAALIGIIVAGNRKKMIYELENEVDDLNEALEKRKQITKDKIAEANDRIRSLKSKIKLLETQVEEGTLVEDNSEEVNKLNVEITSLKAELEKAKKDVILVKQNADNEIKKISKDYDQKIIDVRAECGEKMVDTSDLQKERDELVIRNAELETLVEELKQEATSAKQEVVEAKAAKPKATPKPKKEKAEIKAGEVDWSKYTKTTLYEMALKIPGCPVTAKTSKNDLIALIKQAQGRY